MARENCNQGQKNSPIAIFAYNRPNRILNCLNSLAENEEFKFSQVWIFQDGPKSIDESDYNDTTKVIENFINSKEEFKEFYFIKREYNLGLQDSILNGVDEVLKKSHRIIVIEDDLEVSKFFLRYCNYYLELYELDLRVASIQGYSYPRKGNFDKPYFLKGADCWGWATWKNRWEELERNSNLLLEKLRENRCFYDFDLNGSYSYSNMLRRQSIGKANSWAIRWHASMYTQNRLSLYPPRSLVNNLGGDGKGTNMGLTTQYSTIISNEPVNECFMEPKESKKTRKALIIHFRAMNKISWAKTLAYRCLNIFNLYEKIVLK